MTEFCNLFRRYQPIYKAWMKHGIPERVQRTIKPENVRYQHCPICNERLSHDWMYNNRLSTKSLCLECHNGYFVFNSNDICVMCGDYLSDEKVEACRREPRYVSHRICPGECKEFFILVHANVVMDPRQIQGMHNPIAAMQSRPRQVQRVARQTQTFQERPQPVQNFNVQIINHTHYNEEKPRRHEDYCIDAEFVDEPATPNALTGASLALPPAKKHLTFDAESIENRREYAKLTRKIMEEWGNK